MATDFIQDVVELDEGRIQSQVELNVAVLQDYLLYLFTLFNNCAVNYSVYERKINISGLMVTLCFLYKHQCNKLQFEKKKKDV